MNHKYYVLVLSLLCILPQATDAMIASSYAGKVISSLWNSGKSIENDIKHVTDLLNQAKYSDAYKVINRYGASDLKNFVAPVAQHAVGISNSGIGGIQLLMKMIKMLPYADSAPLVATLAKDAKKASLEILIAIADIKNYTNVIDDAIVNLVNTGDGADLFKGLNYASFKGKTNLPFKLTPTGIHLYKNLWALSSYPVNKHKSDIRLMDIVSQIIAKERELDAQGFYTFLHGQRRVYYFPERLYTTLWQLRKNDICQNFLFAHVKPLLETEKEKNDEEAVRKYLLLHGRKPNDNHTRQKLLFLNYAYFAQMRDMGSNTAHYVAANRNWGSVPINIFPKDAFKLLGFEHIYEKYSSQIEDLQKEHESSGQFGNTLIVAVPKDKVECYAFLCEAGKGLSGRGGVRRAIYIDGMGMTDDIKIIMETLLNNPEKIQDTDDLEFCLIMTQIEGGLDPRTGIQIHPLISGDKTKIARLEEKERKLLQLIEDDIRKEMAAARTHDRMLKIGSHLIGSTQSGPVIINKTAGRIQNILNHLNN